MQICSNHDELFGDPVGRYLPFGSGLLWVHSPTLVGVSMWGRPTKVEAEALVRALDGYVHLAPRFDFLQDGRDIEWTPTPRFTSNSADAALQYAEAGGGITRVLAYQAAEGLKRGRLKIVLAKYEQPALPIHIVYPTSRLLSAKVRAFVDLVVETAEWRFG